MTLP
jgi:hypothetical protein